MPALPAQRQCTPGAQRRITRWEHETCSKPCNSVSMHPQAMRVRRETVEHPFGTLKMRMGATHFLMKRLPKVATEMALHVLAYNLTRVMNIIGVKPLGRSRHEGSIASPKSRIARPLTAVVTAR